MNLGQNIPEFIKIYREGMGLNQTDFAEKMGVTPQYIYNLEHGTSKLPKVFCVKLMKLLGQKEAQWLSDLIGEAALNVNIKKKRLKPGPKSGSKK